MRERDTVQRPRRVRRQDKDCLSSARRLMGLSEWSDRYVRSPRGEQIVRVEEQRGEEMRG